MSNPPSSKGHPPDWTTHVPKQPESSSRTRILISATSTAVPISSRGRKHTPSLVVRSPVPGSVLALSTGEPATIATTTTTTSSSSSTTMPASSSTTTQQHQPPPLSSSLSLQVPVKKKLKKMKKKRHDWPDSSADALPPLSEHLVQRLKLNDFDVPINEECTSLCLSPSGRLVIACFSDGTLRLFDLTGTFAGVMDHNNSTSTNNTGTSHLDWNNLGFDYDSSSSESCRSESSSTSPAMGSPTFSMDGSTKTKKGGRNQIVCSKENQRFGAVVAQIEAKGVHTSLLMDGAVAQDGQYCFAGVSRGSMEMVAVHLGRLEEYYDQPKHSPQPISGVDLLDLVQVFRYSDAKLRGFGACTRVRNGGSDDPAKYLLCTGKGIKNIHIWSFEPPRDPCSGSDDAKWVQLYNTPTNGNTITFLQFRYDPNGLLHAISKSGDDALLRVWDLSYEQHHGNSKNPFYNKTSIIKKFAKTITNDTSRPKKPLFVDVANSESTMSVCGGFAVCAGRSGMYNQISMICLDDSDLQSPFNHTELALPESAGGGVMARTSRRQQRGELKSIVNIAGMIMDPRQFLLEVCDGTIIGYSQIGDGAPNLKLIPGTVENGFAALQQEGVCKQLCLGRIGSEGIVVAAVATYNADSGKGRLSLRELTATESPVSGADKENAIVAAPKGFWGFAPQRGRSKPAVLKVMSDPQDISMGNGESTAKACSFEPANPRQSQSLKKSQDVATKVSRRHSVTNKVKTAVASSDMCISSPFPLAEREDIVNWVNPPASVPRGAHHHSTSVKLFGGEASERPPLFSPKALKRKSSTEFSRIGSSKAFNKMIKQSTEPLATPKYATTLQSKSQNTVNSAPPSNSSQREMPPKCTPASTGIPIKQPSAPRQGPAMLFATANVLSSDATKSAFKNKIGSKQPAPLLVGPKGLARITPTNNQNFATGKHPSNSPPTAGHGDAAATKCLESPSSSNLVEEAKEVSPESVTKPGTGKIALAGQSWLKDAEPASTPPSASSTISASAPNTEASPPVPRKSSNSANAASSKEKDELDDDLHGIAATLVNLGSTPLLKSAPPIQPVVEETPAAKQPVVSDIKMSETMSKPKRLRSQTPTPRRKNLKKSPAVYQRRSNVPSQAFRQQCITSQKQVQEILQRYTNQTNIFMRMGLASSTIGHDEEDPQELARKQLLAHHLATHEMLLRKVLYAANSTLQALRRSQTCGAVDDFSSNFQETVQSYREMLIETLQRQRLEASTLAAQQTLVTPHGVLKAPEFEVSFPFFDVLDEAISYVEDAVSASF